MTPVGRLGHRWIGNSIALRLLAIRTERSQIFGTDPSGNIWTSNQILGGDQFATVRSNSPAPATDSWTSLKQMDGSSSQVAAVTDANGFIHLFGINPAGNLFHRRQAAQNATDPSIGGAWTAWDQVQSPESLRMIAVTVDSPGHINIFGITAGGGPIAHLAPGGNCCWRIQRRPHLPTRQTRWRDHVYRLVARFRARSIASLLRMKVVARANSF